MHAQAQPSEKPPQPSTVDPADVERFSRIAAEWWNPNGKFKPLHDLNPTRIAYIRDTIAIHFNHPNPFQSHHHEPSQPRHPEPVSGSKKMLNQVQHDEIFPQYPNPSPSRGEATKYPASSDNSRDRGAAKRGEVSRASGEEAARVLNEHPSCTPAAHPAITTPLTLLDIGTGGGLIAEPMARLGATVTGIDASEKNIAVASLHAQQSGLSITYHTTTAEAMAKTKQTFNVVLALEIVEHVADVPLFLASCATLVAPGGLLILSTLNRTTKSYIMAIIGAEYVLRLLPRGTHSWKQFIRPSELATAVTATGMNVSDITGMVLNPRTWHWHLDTHDLSVNYLLTATKPA